MTPARKYQWMIAATLILFLYLLPTEVWDRWKQTGALYNELGAKEEQSPEKLPQKRTNLRARQETLTSILRNDAGQFEQSQTGQVEFLNATARETGVKLESLVPVSVQTSGQIQEIGFSIRLASDFHGLGRFVNALERSGTIIRIRQMEVAAPEKGKKTLSATIEGCACLMPKRHDHP